ncbi:MAG: hypothetical protein ABJC63_12650 [Gemmatimonadales bacterium]
MSFTFRSLRLRAVFLIQLCTALAVILAPLQARAQHDHDDDDHDDDHHHAPVHFSHPLFTESPSPDTKLRLDFIRGVLAHDVNENTLRVEGEYAFSRNVSLEANVPLTSRSVSGNRTTAVGSGELALKLATFAAAAHGVLLGGGVAFGVPTGNEEKGIGSGHLIEIEPYVDAGWMRGALELVSFASYSTTTRRNSGDEKEESLALAASALYHLSPRFESLVELEGRRSVSGEESGHQIVNAGAGVKYHIARMRALVVGVGGRIPLTTNREFQSEMILSALYHF